MGGGELGSRNSRREAQSPARIIYPRFRGMDQMDRSGGGRNTEAGRA